LAWGAAAITQWWRTLILITGNRGNVTNMSELNALELRDLSNNNFGGLIPLTFGTLMNIEVI
jgi:hypothetical protein